VAGVVLGRCAPGDAGHRGGGYRTLGGNLLWMAIAVVLGCALGTFFMAFHSTQGPQLGLPQMIQSRPQFGYIGALLVWGVALMAYIGFNAFNQVLAVQTLQSLYGGAASPTMLIFVCRGAGLAIVGYDIIHLAQRWIAYVLIGPWRCFHARCCAHALPAAQWDAMRLSRGAVPGAVVRRRLLPALLVDLCVGLLALPAARRRRGRSSFWWTYLGAFVGGAG
jgi:nucleobase:cation symporter-1, NCS1 family